MGKKFELNGFKMIIQVDEDLNNKFPSVEIPKTGKKHKFTDVLEYLYLPLNKPELTSSFLSDDEIKTEHISQLLTLNAFNRFVALNSLLSIVDQKIYNEYLSNNTLRMRLCDKGLCIFKDRNGSYYYKCFNNYIFPTIDNDSNPNKLAFKTKKRKSKHKIFEFDSNMQKSEPRDNDEYIFAWPGCSLVMPKSYNIRTILNPEIHFPIVNINSKKDKKVKTIGVYENDWGVNVLESEGGLCDVKMISTSDTDSKLNVNHRTLLDNSGKTKDFASYNIVLQHCFLNNSIECIVELPFLTARQDVLTKISKENSDETPIFFTCCT